MGILAADSSLAEQFGPYVVSGIIALAGVWLGKLWERQSSTEAWRRDQRLTAYAAIVQAVNEVVGRVADVYVAEGARKGELAQKYRDATMEFRRRRTVIQLLGPTEVSSAVIEFEYAVERLFNNVSRPNTGTKAQLYETSEYTAVDQTYVEIVAAAQQALG